MKLAWSAMLALLLLLASHGASKARSVPEAESIATPHFLFTFARGAAVAVRPLADEAEQVRRRLCKELDVPCFTQQVRVHIARSVEEFVHEQPGGPEQGGHIDWASGVAYSDLDYIVLRRDPTTLLGLSETFAHEVSHVVLRKGVGGRFLPRWFLEGVAILQAGESVQQRFESAASASLTGSLIPIRELTFRFPRDHSGIRLAYAESALFLRWLLEEYDPQGHVKLVAHVRQGKRFQPAFEEVFGDSPDALWQVWSSQFREGVSWIPLLTGSSLLWLLLTGVFLWVYWKKRRATRQRLAQWAEEEDDDERLDLF